MDRVAAGLVALMGLAAVLLNRRFARSSVITSREFFGIELPEGTRRHRVMTVYARVLTIVVGALMILGGGLLALGVDWRDWF